ncbi:Cryptic sugar kinase Mak [hydrothermal vent metagenome]|uniref:Cryptic sugar kinase Mak n=1 Tax=hydrothermal vent metagenome TaxID=652676 RepID=A0A3B0XWE9_9ZZZZ
MKIGIDLGGTKIECIALDEQGSELFRHRVATPCGDYSGTLKAIGKLVRVAENTMAETGTVGVGAPGALSPESGLLRNSNSICMNGERVKDDLQKILNRDVRISNDANCFALSEAIDGSAKGAHVVFGVIIGTGTGAGIVVNGQVLTGPNAIAGEWGHNPLPWPNNNERPGPECYCGKQGCIETFLSGPGLSNDYFLSSGKNLTAIEIAGLAENNDLLAEESMRQYENRLARGLAHVINILDPDVIVLGGGMSNISRLYESVPKILNEYVFSDVLNTRLLAPEHGDSSGVRGAAWLWD